MKLGFGIYMFGPIVRQNYLRLIFFQTTNAKNGAISPQRLYVDKYKDSSS